MKQLMDIQLPVMAAVRRSARQVEPGDGRSSNHCTDLLYALAGDDAKALAEGFNVLRELSPGVAMLLKY
jgi:hypothetical protein